MKGHSLQLIPLSEDTLEQVRLWRNNPNISRFMEFKGEISVEQQLKWFQSVGDDHYFVIHYGKNPVGLINLKNINNKSAESGLFIGDEKYLGIGLAFEASLLLLDFAFNDLELLTITAKVNIKNKVAEDYNRMFGFQFNKTVNDEFQEWLLTKETYFQKRKHLEMMLLK